jgi:ectoine hydroxylase
MSTSFQLSKQQVEEFNTKGYVMVDSLLSKEECDVLEAGRQAVQSRKGPEVAREVDGSPHVVYGVHLWDERFKALARHYKVLGPAEQLLGKQVFIHQSRCNAKATMGSIVDWHQDWGTYHRVDGVPTPEGLMIAVHLDDITACNAPLLAVPGTNHSGLVSEASKVESDTTAEKHRFDIRPETMATLVEENGLEALTGPRGSVLFMKHNVVHGSSMNITPLSRTIIYVNCCAIDNQGKSFARPEYYAARDFTPLEPLGEGGLEQFA